MSPITHFFISWSVANTAGLDRRDRALVTLAGIIPDADGVGIMVDFFMRRTSSPTDFWTQWHHILGHNLGFAFFIVLLAALLAHRRKMTAFLVFIAFNLHILGDIIGARGPDGNQWPIPYFSPFYRGLELCWEGQWALNAWPNFLITAVCLFFMFSIAVKKGISPLELISKRADQAFVGALQKRFAPHD